MNLSVPHKVIPHSIMVKQYNHGYRSVKEYPFCGSYLVGLWTTGMCPRGTYGLSCLPQLTGSWTASWQWWWWPTQPATSQVMVTSEAVQRSPDGPFLSPPQLRRGPHHVELDLLSEWNKTIITNTLIMTRRGNIENEDIVKVVGNQVFMLVYTLCIGRQKFDFFL